MVRSATITLCMAPRRRGAGVAISSGQEETSLFDAAPPQAMPAPPPNVAPAVMQSVVLNPTPADEQRRLEAVASEVARRRAMREQATQQIGQGGAPPNLPPQNAPGNPAGGRPPGQPTQQAR